MRTRRNQRVRKVGRRLIGSGQVEVRGQRGHGGWSTQVLLVVEAGGERGHWGRRGHRCDAGRFGLASNFWFCNEDVAVLLIDHAMPWAVCGGRFKHFPPLVASHFCSLMAAAPTTAARSTELPVLPYSAKQLYIERQLL